MTGDGLLTERSKLLPETPVATTEMGVVITTSWNRVMHTATSDRILGETGCLRLEDLRAEGVRVAYPDSVKDLSGHLEAIHQCNASSVALYVVGELIDVLSCVSSACATRTARTRPS